MTNHFDMPSADDPVEPLEQRLERLEHIIDEHVARFVRIRKVLSAFYLAPISGSSVQPILQLAEELNPTLVRRAQVGSAGYVVADDTLVITSDDTPF